ncbi:MAG: hypothetical protein E7177_07580 [Erysipelotrichaceae bacterium]|nr:hypothetical protein [Erysipelotrichaceae bacterium]
MTTSSIRKSNERNSIIVVGIILGVVLLVFSFLLIPFSLKDSLFEYGEVIKNDDIDVSTLGELSMLYYLIVGIGAFVLYAYGYGMAVSIIIASIVLLILSLKNRKMENKTLKIINWVYVGLCSLMLVTSIVKIVLFIFKIN